jgi:hypothetical protein
MDYRTGTTGRPPTKEVGSLVAIKTGGVIAVLPMDMRRDRDSPLRSSGPVKASVPAIRMQLSPALEASR